MEDDATDKEETKVRKTGSGAEATGCRAAAMGRFCGRMAMPCGISAGGGPALPECGQLPLSSSEKVGPRGFGPADHGQKGCAAIHRVSSTPSPPNSPDKLRKRTDWHNIQATCINRSQVRSRHHVRKQ